MTRGPSWLISASNGRRIFGSGAEVGNTEMNPGGDDWTEYGSVGSSENTGVGKIEGGQVLSMELNMGVGTLKFWVDGHRASGRLGSHRSYTRGNGSGHPYPNRTTCHSKGAT